MSGWRLRGDRNSNAYTSYWTVPGTMPTQNFLYKKILQNSTKFNKHWCGQSFLCPISNENLHPLLINLASCWFFIIFIDMVLWTFSRVDNFSRVFSSSTRISTPMSCCIEYLFKTALFLNNGLHYLVLVQYAKNYRPFKDIPIFERFPVVISVLAIWVFATILTGAGAYNHRPARTQSNCRTDRANLISSAPW